VREHNEALNTLDFMPDHREITADYAPGSVELVTQHDGSILKLRKLHSHYDPTDRAAAIAYLHERAAEGEIVTGLLYVDPEPKELHDYLSTPRPRRSTPWTTAGWCPARRRLKRLTRGCANRPRVLRIHIHLGLETKTRQAGRPATRAAGSSPAMTSFRSASPSRCRNGRCF
jgi:hypothetical protein